MTRIYFSTVIRCAPPDRGGAFVRLDWATKRVERTVGIAATNPSLHDTNPRGSTRGGRGIARAGDGLVVASYHTLLHFSRDLEPRGGATNGLMVGLHELDDSCADGTLWVSSTSLEAALRMDPHTAEIHEQRWPQDFPEIREALNLAASKIDRAADNRALFVNREGKHGIHPHLNAVRVYDGRLLALLHGHGAIVDLDRGTVVVRHDALLGAHNLIVRPDGIGIVNDTRRAMIRFFDLEHGTLEGTIDLRDFPWVRQLERSVPTRKRVARAIRRFRGRPVRARPLFLRGLAREGGRLFVGLSPAAILEIDEERGTLLDWYQHSTDVNECVHGLLAEKADPGNCCSEGSDAT